MIKSEINRVVFHSAHDMSSGHFLSKAESILKSEIVEDINDINDVLELYNIKLFFDNGIYLQNWSDSDSATYKETANKFGQIIGKFINKINDSNFQQFHSNLSYSYVKSFWTLINNHQQFKKISPVQITEVLNQNPHQVRDLLIHKNLVNRYKDVLCDFLKKNEQSAEIILSIYEVEDSFNHIQMHLPSCLTITDKENIISSYIASEHCNMNYLPIIQNAKKHNGFYISDKVKLEAKRKYQQETSKFFNNSTNNSFEYGVSISYPENASKIKSIWLEKAMVHYEYSLDYIKENNHPYILYKNFKTLFEYVDEHNIVALTSKQNQLGIFERTMGVRSKNEYLFGVAFTQLEMASIGQISTYSKTLAGLGHSLEKILQTVFNTVLPELYGLLSNANLTTPTVSASALEKVRIIAPEFESILKQYKLFVENGQIDFELLQMSSGPTSIKDIPSLNDNKYIYVNRGDQKVNYLTHLLFSDQTLLTYVEPFKDNRYKNFVDLLVNEEEIEFNNYEEHQIENLNYLIENNYIFVDENNHIKVTNWNRILILRDVFENEVASYHHYPSDAQEEVIIMCEENLLYFENNLFSTPEQNYFNYYLNKSEFTNGLDLRNSYLHGTQANPSENQLHENSYLLYLKLLTLAILKIEDDLSIYNKLKQSP
jgi:hypothetical protein